MPLENQDVFPWTRVLRNAALRAHDGNAEKAASEALEEEPLQLSEQVNPKVFISPATSFAQASVRLVPQQLRGVQ